ncbi:hypothetical protein CBL_07972 [Carabus blaptoides fortunei]
MIRNGRLRTSHCVTQSHPAPTPLLLAAGGEATVTERRLSKCNAGKKQVAASSNTSGGNVCWLNGLYELQVRGDFGEQSCCDYSSCWRMWLLRFNTTWLSFLFRAVTTTCEESGITYRPQQQATSRY